MSVALLFEQWQVPAQNFSAGLNSILCNFSYSVDLIFALKKKIILPWALKMNQLDIYEMTFFNH